MAFECDDLRLGGTLSATGITGGLSINSTAIEVVDWSNVLGWPGVAGEVIQVNGRPGGQLTGDLLARPRFFNLNLRFTRFGPVDFTLVEPTPQEQLVANTDDFLTLLTTPNQLLELDMPDGSSRFLRASALDPTSIIQPRRERSANFAMVGSHYWRAGGNQSTDTINGADTMVVGGNAPVYDAVLVFSGDGTFTHNTLDWELEITGSTSAVTVDLGNRTVTQAGSPAPNLLRRDRRDWGWFVPGNNSVTTDISVGVTWRNAYV